MSDPLLETEDLTIQYRTSEGSITAVADASIEIGDSTYFGLIGESGCGKTTIIKAIMGGLPNNGYIDSGTIRYKGTEIQDYSERELNRHVRWKEISWIPQGALNSLDPLETIGDQAVEIARVHTDLTRSEALEKFREMFDIVGLPTDRIDDYPFEFSGGMQQRAIIAMALFLDPELIIADEPTTALDVIMQDQVFKYLDQIKDSGVSLMLITHDISVVFESCEEIAVMHSGQVAESGTVEEVFDGPRHPYSILLQEAFPDIRYPDRDLETIEGHPPENLGDVDYCTFVDRCPWAVEECSERAPPLEPIDGSETHRASCFRKDEVLEMYRQEASRAPSGGSDSA